MRMIGQQDIFCDLNIIIYEYESARTDKLVFPVRLPKLHSPRASMIAHVLDLRELIPECRGCHPLPEASQYLIRSVPESDGRPV